MKFSSFSLPITLLLSSLGLYYFKKSAESPANAPTASTSPKTDESNNGKFPQKIFIIRHGQRRDFIDKTWSETAAHPEDPPLSELGLQQAEQVGAHFKTTHAASMNSSNTVLVVSPFFRCIQTATPIAKALNLKICVEYGITEWHQFVKAAFFESTLKEFRSKQQEFVEHYIHLLDHQYESLLDVNEYFLKKDSFEETMVALEARLNKSVNDLAKRYQNVIVVTHAASAIVLARTMLQDHKQKIRTGVCSITTLVKNPEEYKNQNWNVLTNGFTEHLEAGEMHHWEFPENE